MKIFVGIDEAGRGPVLGPMVIAGVKALEDDLKAIKELGAKDSKLLSPTERDRLFEIIINHPKLEHHIIIIPPSEIDEAINSANGNLNWLEAIKSAMIINKLRPTIAIVDCPSTNIKAYADYIQRALTIPCEIRAEHKADVNHPIAGAASILAKVTRDRIVSEFAQKLGRNVGSGYPSDPYTISFLERNYTNKEVTPFIRKSWASYKKLIDGKNQKTLGSF